VIVIFLVFPFSPSHRVQPAICGMGQCTLTCIVAAAAWATALGCRMETDGQNYWCSSGQVELTGDEQQNYDLECDIGQSCCCHAQSGEDLGSCGACPQAGPTSPPTFAPTRAPTLPISTLAASPYAPGSTTATAIFSNDGSIHIDGSQCMLISGALPADAIAIEVVMGEVRDYFQPATGLTLMDMICGQAAVRFFDGSGWVAVPGAHLQGHLGGSTAAPGQLYHRPGDERSYLAFWGSGSLSTH